MTSKNDLFDRSLIELLTKSNEAIAIVLERLAIVLNINHKLIVIKLTKTINNLGSSFIMIITAIVSQSATSSLDPELNRTIPTNLVKIELQPVSRNSIVIVVSTGSVDKIVSITAKITTAREASSIKPKEILTMKKQISNNSLPAFSANARKPVAR